MSSVYMVFLSGAHAHDSTSASKSLLKCASVLSVVTGPVCRVTPMLWADTVSRDSGGKAAILS